LEFFFAGKKNEKELSRKYKDGPTWWKVTGLEPDCFVGWLAGANLLLSLGILAVLLLLIYSVNPH